MAEQMTKLIDEAESALLHTYNRYQVVLDHGEGVYLYDTDGKKYLDFGSGIAVCAAGYGDKRYTSALKHQIDTLMHTSNYFYNEPAIRAAKRLTEITGMAKVFFTNSGAEAVEGALKSARKHAFLKDGETDHEIIAFLHSFHGRTFGALSVTGTESYRAPFLPMIGGIRFATFNDLESVKALVTDKTCAIIVEPVQGEGGIIPATKEFLQGLRTLCDEHDLVLICDEIQCGAGRTGTFLASAAYDVRPDIVTLAKGIGAGFPVGAFLLNERVAASSLAAGDHGSTYGGNPLACAAINATLDLFEEDHIIEHVAKIGPYLQERLQALAKDRDCVVTARGIGLIQGLELKIPAGEVTTKALSEGLILMSAAGNTIRFVPPLVIEEAHMDEMIRILTRCLPD